MKKNSITLEDAIDEIEEDVFYAKERKAVCVYNVRVESLEKILDYIKILEANK